jgi:transcription termination factor Rho
LHAAELAGPLALGQRALVVGPPGTGKTTVLRAAGAALLAARPGIDLHVVLVDRPVEEFLEWRYELPGAQVHGTASDEPPEAHARVDEPFARAVEVAADGGDAAVLVDSLAALARALNVVLPHDERILTGGIMATALRETRQLFGLARAYDEGGSLTIVATADVDTGSELDDVVFHELVGTGNMELRLSEEVRQAGLLPALDVAGSGARHVEGILGDELADRRARLRADVTAQGPGAGLALLLGELERAGDLAALLPGPD